MSDAAVIDRRRETAFRAFLVRFRREVGRPMTEAEHHLAQLAYQYGWHDGLDAALDEHGWPEEDS